MTINLRLRSLPGSEQEPDEHRRSEPALCHVHRRRLPLGDGRHSGGGGRKGGSGRKRRERGGQRHGQQTDGALGQGSGGRGGGGKGRQSRSRLPAEAETVHRWKGTKIRARVSQPSGRFTRVKKVHSLLTS